MPHAMLTGGPLPGGGTGGVAAEDDELHQLVVAIAFGPYPAMLGFVIGVVVALILLCRTYADRAADAKADCEEQRARERWGEQIWVEGRPARNTETANGGGGEETEGVDYRDDHRNSHRDSLECDTARMASEVVAAAVRAALAAIPDEQAPPRCSGICARLCCCVWRAACEPPAAAIGRCCTRCMAGGTCARLARAVLLVWLLAFGGAAACAARS